MMFKKMILGAAAVTLLLIASLMFFPDHALAAPKGDAGADKEMATKDGLATKEFDKDKLPGKFELGLTVGSVIAVIATVKYL